MTTMIERIARAIYEAAWNSEPDQFVSALHDLDGNMHATLDGEFDMRIFARAVLKAMREPTTAMIDAGNDCGDWGPPGYSDHANGPAGPENCWPAMIDAALKEDGQ